MKFMHVRGVFGSEVEHMSMRMSAHSENARA